MQDKTGRESTTKGTKHTKEKQGNGDDERLRPGRRWMLTEGKSRIKPGRVNHERDETHKRKTEKRTRTSAVDADNQFTPEHARRHGLVVFSPGFTPEHLWLATARAAGCDTVDGGGMAVWQAVGAFKLFTGMEPDAARMEAHFRRMLAARAGTA